MAPKTRAELTDRVSIILEDTANTHFADATITSEMDNCIPIVSQCKPQEVRYIKMVANSAKLSKTLSGVHTGREIDISDIDYISINRVEFPVGNFPPYYRNFRVYNDMLFLEIPTRASAGQQNDARGTAQVLTGTVTFTSGSPAVTGSGTAFTSELEPGYYISKSGSDNWYRVATITDDTNLVLSINCDSGDTGADTAGATRYWYEYAYIFAKVNHYNEATQTDFGGTINAGVATGYAEGTWQIDVDALGTGTMPKNMLFTIAGTEGVYRITEEATITTLEATLKISPRLKGRATENAVVTFIGSSLTPELEEILCDLTAAKVAKNFFSTSRTALANTVTAYGNANTELDKMAAITNSANTDCGTALTAASANFSNATGAISTGGDLLDDAGTTIGTLHSIIQVYTAKAQTILESTDAGGVEKILDDLNALIGDYTTETDMALASIDLANTAVDDAELVVDEINTDIDAQLDEIGAAAALQTTELAQSITDLDTVEDNLNVVTLGTDPAGKGIQKAMAQMAYANAKRGEIESFIREGYALNPSVAGHLSVSRAYLNEAVAKINLEGALIREHYQELTGRIRQTQSLVGLEPVITGEYSVEAGRLIQQASGEFSQANAYIRIDAQKVASIIRVISARLSTAGSYYRAASGYFGEASASIRLSQAVHQSNVWADKKYNEVMQRLIGSVGFRVREPTV